MGKTKKLILLALLFFTTRAFAERVSIVNWNLQTFFDAVSDGTEYSDFKKTGYWNSQNYIARLNRLTDAIKEIDTDIFVFEEIENSAVLQDISNKLEDHSFNSSKNWHYAAFAKNPNDAIGLGVLSRYPLSEITIHNLDIKTEDETQPSMRPILRIKVTVKDSDFILLVNHWKSKSSGEQESEIWRTWQEKLLCDIFKKETVTCPSVLACGDFNKNITEFTIINEDKENILLNESFSVYSPWIKSNGKLPEPGSYYYKDEWEYIDHFFSTANLRLCEFEALKGPWCDENGRPTRFIIYNGTGYSDHLPIKCVVNID